MEKLPSGYKTFESTLIQKRGVGSSHAKDLLGSQIHKTTTEDQN